MAESSRAAPARLAPDGVILLASAFDMDATLERLGAAIAGQGMALLAEIDHAVGAAKAGLSMRPMRVLMFGNAHAGTPLLQAEPTIGIDLPLRALVWTEQDGGVRVALNDPATIASRHGALAGHEAVVAAMQLAVQKVADAATRQ